MFKAVSYLLSIQNVANNLLLYPLLYYVVYQGETNQTEGANTVLSKFGDTILQVQARP